ncbi:MAG: bile acid:sodium symporter [Cellvibrionaceae bacterium]|nr:bile acid:sodium symporter [Cellvibrionaceae bacterium]
MTADILSQILLPLGLALMMLAMGLSLQVEHFSNILRYPKALGLGLLLQFLLLPALAWLIIGLLGLPPVVAAGLLLVSLAPGGATSNAISLLCRGDTALSISLTAVGSVIVPFSLPPLLALQYGWLGFAATEIELSVTATIAKLMVISLLPVLLGMGIRHWLGRRLQPWQGASHRVVGTLFVLLVATMAWINRDKLSDLAAQTSTALILLSSIAMLASLAIARLAGLDTRQQRTLGVEVGIQNAGTAIMVAATLMGRYDLALIALLYGLTMNIPAFAMVAWVRWGRRSHR